MPNGVQYLADNTVNTKSKHICHIAIEIICKLTLVQYYISQKSYLIFNENNVVKYLIKMVVSLNIIFKL